MRRRIRVTSLAAVLTLAATVLLSGGTGQAAAPTPPPDDPFYQPPAGYESTAPGTVLRSREVQLAAFSLLPQKVRSWQLLYRTTDWQGRPDATATTVLLPWGAKPDKSRPLLSYQVAQDSTAPQCVPSYVLRQGSGFEGVVTQAELLLIDAAVRQGWAVSVPDHEGRGGHLGVAKEPGYMALDGIRAAENFAPLGLNGADTKVGMWGYSGGGLATGWTVEMQPSYAPELNVAGAAMGGPVPNLVSLLERANGKPFAGLIPLGIAALRKTYPHIADVVNEYLTPEGQAIINRADTECTQPTVARNAFVNFNNHTRIPLPEVVQLPQVRQVAEEVRLGNHSPTAPLYVYHSVNDELPAIADTDHQVANYCATGTAVTYKRDIASEHASLVITGAADALNWLKQRLGGTPAPPACTTETVVSTLATPSALATFGTVLLQDLLALLGQPIRPTGTASTAAGDARTEAVAPVTFAPKQEYATGGLGGSGWDETSTAVGDFTNDGDPDVVTADLFNPAGSGPILLLNKGDGTLTSPGKRITTTPFTGTVATGDLNNDRNLDLVAGANWGFFVRLGNGDGTFREGEFQYVVQAFQNDIEIGDVDTDGNPDVIVRALHGIVVYLGTGDGTFPQTKTTIFTGGVTPGFSGISLADFDNDGNPDLAASDAVTQRVVTLQGDGQGTFTPLGSGPSAIVPGTVLTGDFNHDGIDDAAALNEFNTIDAARSSAVVLISNGKGGFLPPQTYGGGFAPVSGTVGDLNNDGNPDIVSSDVAFSKQVVLLGDGHGGFIPGGAYDVGLLPQTPAVGDLNGDHKPDIVTTAVTTGILPGVSGVSVLRNIS